MNGNVEMRDLSWVVLLHQLPAGAAKARVRERLKAQGPRLTAYGKD